MNRFDQKTQMMDAGTVLFPFPGGFGSALGTVKALMKEYGRVLTVSEAAVPDAFQDSVDPAGLPPSTAACDLFLDYSTPWRHRYVSCLLEDAGPGEGDVRRYAAVFKQGDRSTPLRAAVHLLLIVAGGVLVFLPVTGFAGVLAGLALAALAAYGWIVPSRKALRVLHDIQDRLRA